AADGHAEAVAERVVAVPLNRLSAAPPTELRAGPPVKLRVRAVATDGKTVAGARVALVDGEPDRDRQFSWGRHDVGWDNIVRGRAGPDGWADFPALTFGEATVLVQAPGFARQYRGWRNGAKELTIKLAREAVLVGEVRDAAGAPVK